MLTKEQLTRPLNCPWPHSIWRHYKGHLCVVISVGPHTETGEWLVVYSALDSVYCRPLTMWNDLHSSGAKRFTLIEG